MRVIFCYISYSAVITDIYIYILAISNHSMKITVLGFIKHFFSLLQSSFHVHILRFCKTYICLQRKNLPQFHLNGSVLTKEGLDLNYILLIKKLLKGIKLA